LKEEDKMEVQTMGRQGLEDISTYGGRQVLLKDKRESSYCLFLSIKDHVSRADIYQSST
jgi:hypothetical protein